MYIAKDNFYRVYQWFSLCTLPLSVNVCVAYHVVHIHCMRMCVYVSSRMQFLLLFNYLFFFVVHGTIIIAHFSKTMYAKFKDKSYGENEPIRYVSVSILCNPQTNFIQYTNYSFIKIDRSCRTGTNLKYSI